jgi:hypothetical protein
VKFPFRLSRGRCRLANAYDAEGGSQFRAILQLIRQVHSSAQRPCGSIDGLTAEVPTAEGYVDACLFGSLRDSQVKAHFRAMFDPFGGHLGRDVYRNYRCFDSGDRNTLVARPTRRTLTNFLMRALA